VKENPLAYLMMTVKASTSTLVWLSRLISMRVRQRKTVVFVSLIRDENTTKPEKEKKRRSDRKQDIATEQLFA
jgi:hypothetical protein